MAEDDVMGTVQEVAPTAPDVPIVETNTNSMVDRQAYDNLAAEITKLNAGFSEVSKKAEKFDKVRAAFSGDEESNSKERFVEDFVKDPESVIKRIQKETIDKEVNPLKEQLKNKGLEEADSRAMSYLKATDSDYDDVVANMKTYVAQDFEKEKDNPDRFEIMYSLTKTRMQRDINKKAAQTKAIGEAKTVSNTTAVSAQPTTVINSEPDSPNQRFYNDIDALKQDWKSEDILDKWVDVFFDEDNPQGFWSKHSKD